MKKLTHTDLSFTSKVETETVSIIPKKETCELEIVNRLLKVLYRAWKPALPFRQIIMKEIYISANEDRSEYVSEIQVLDF